MRYAFFSFFVLITHKYLLLELFSSNLIYLWATLQMSCVEEGYVFIFST